MNLDTLLASLLHQRYWASDPLLRDAAASLVRICESVRDNGDIGEAVEAALRGAHPEKATALASVARMVGLEIADGSSGDEGDEAE